MKDIFLTLYPRGVTQIGCSDNHTNFLFFYLVIVNPHQYHNTYSVGEWFDSRSILRHSQIFFLLLLCHINDINILNGENHYHAQLGLPNTGCAIKGFGSLEPAQRSVPRL